MGVDRKGRASKAVAGRDVVSRQLLEGGRCQGSCRKERGVKAAAGRSVVSRKLQEGGGVKVVAKKVYLDNTPFQQLP